MEQQKVGKFVRKHDRREFIRSLTAMLLGSTVLAKYGCEVEPDESIGNGIEGPPDDEPKDPRSNETVQSIIENYIEGYVGQEITIEQAYEEICKFIEENEQGNKLHGKKTHFNAAFFVSGKGETYSPYIAGVRILDDNYVSENKDCEELTVKKKLSSLLIENGIATFGILEHTMDCPENEPEPEPEQEI